MALETLDWVVIIGLLGLFIGIGVWYGAKSKQSMEGYFLGGRSLPWWIAGTSMVATTFAADTPLLVTELVAEKGVSGNWLWWNMLAGGMLTTFFFAKLWRRSGVVTEVELSELRYSGIGARLLRGTRSVYLGLIMNVAIMTWVNAALITLLIGFFGLETGQALIWMGVIMGLVATYSAFSGLLGVVMTDVVQFVVAMVGCIILAILVVNSEQIGGITSLKAKLPDGALNLFPSFDASQTGTQLTIGIGSFLAMVGMSWWMSWYPGAEPGGGGYVAQRMMSTSSESQALKSVLFFQVAHYAIRPWPWVIVALCASILYPELAESGEARSGFVYVMRDYLPTGLRGLLLVAFLAAYMSTISTQLNWGSSYLVNDLYDRFIQKGTSQRNLITVSRLVVLALAAVSFAVTPFVTTITGAWEFVIECGAGLGLVLILRWYWWRINAWSEITAMVVPFVVYATAKFGLVYLDPAWGLGLTKNPQTFLLVVSVTTVAWLIVTFLTEPTSQKTLSHFYQKVSPQGYWKPVRESLGLARAKNEIPALFVQWIMAIAFAYGLLFSIGQVILMEWTAAAIYGTVTIVSGYLVFRSLD